jgi:hypothetical protein
LPHEEATRLVHPALILSVLSVARILAQLDVWITNVRETSCEEPKTRLVRGTIPVRAMAARPVRRKTERDGGHL